jgi:hypothetical protein
MNQKASERPTLQGQRIKTRKRDEKEKFDATAFRDSIFAGINESSGDLELLSKFLDTSGNKLDYRRYGEPLFDILIAGGLLAPGGNIVEDPAVPELTRTETSVFARSGDDESIKAYAQVITKLIRRYKYLEKTLEEDLKKIIVFLKAFTVDEREKLAKLCAILLSGGQINTYILSAALQDHLVKDGIASEFLINVLKVWQSEKDANQVWTALRKSSLDSKLLDFYPTSKRTQETLSTTFTNAGLTLIVDFQRAQLGSSVKKELQTKLSDLIQENASVKELIALVKEHVVKYTLNEPEVAVLLWNTLMSAMEWNKKEELVADQALKHLRGYNSLLAEFTKSPKAELALLVRIQEFCYENMNFLKVFQKIVVLLYKTDVISEDTILKWYTKDHSNKGKGHFLEQMKKFVEWLQNAEEESENSD